MIDHKIGFAVIDSKATRILFLVVLLSPVPLLAIHFSVWGWERFVDSVLGGGLVFIPAFVLGAVAHEVLHFLPLWLVGKVKPGNVRFGFDKKSLTPFIECKEEVTAFAFVTCQLAPLLIMSLPPAALALIYGNDPLALWSSTMISGCCYDVAAANAMRKIPMRAWVWPQGIKRNETWGFAWSLGPKGTVPRQ